ncbi:MAG: phosphoglycolate phosphatase [Methanobacterium sp. BRmetb2]|nr:MAG: phosphoglycolate phosphatase [Methanobacterium sp. BRmetb2]
MMKAIALDVDGTITNKNRRACVSAIKAIHQAEDSGIPVIIVTGNMLCSSKMISTLLGTTGGLVAENGGIIETPKGRKVLGDFSKCENAYNYLKSKHDVEKVDLSSHRISEIALTRKIPVEIIKETLKDFEIKIYDSKFAIHLTDPAVSKGSSLKMVAEDLGINVHDIIAIGDSENDMEFLEVAGFKVAVANANPELKDIADYVTTSYYGDGAAEAIHKFVL